MKKAKRLLTGLLCVVLFLTNIMSTGIQVLAVELGIEQTYVDESQSEMDVLDGEEDTPSEDDGEKDDSQDQYADDEGNNAGTKENPEDESQENSEETISEEPNVDSPEQEESEDEETTGNDTEIGTENSETEDEQGTSDETDESTKNEQDIDVDKMLSLSAAERLELMSSDDDIASGIDGNITWVIDANGKLAITGTGNYNHFVSLNSPWGKYRYYIIDAEVNVTGMTDASNMFDDCINLKSIDLSNFDTSKITNMSWMFYCCESLTNLDVSKFNTSNVTDMSAMFSGCTSLLSLDVSKFNTSKVTDMSYMFSACESLTSLDVSKFSTNKVTDMSGMFGGCESLTNLNVSNFNTSNVTNMREMFSECYEVTELDVSKFDTSKVTDMLGMFARCSSLAYLDVSDFNTENVTNMGDIAYFDVDTEMVLGGMFSGCSNLTELDLSNFDTRNVEYMTGMFSDCSKLTMLDISSFDTSKVIYMSHMFSGCNSLQELDLSSFDVSSVADHSDEYYYGNEMFYNCTNLSTIKAPYNLNVTVELPANSGDIWYGADGSVVTKLPQGLGYSVILGKNYIPKEKIPKIRMGTNLEDASGNDVIYETDLNWDDNWFLEASTTYNHALARTSIDLCGVAYTGKDAVSDAMGYMHFAKVNTRNYDNPATDDNNDIVAYSVWKKQLSDGTTLVAVIIRGTKDKEWYSNFNVGTGKIHKGFLAARGEIVRDLNTYLEEIGRDNVKFYVTGHSRGAAVANLLAALLTDSFGEQNVYAYTFATPTVSTEGQEIGYRNIFNIVNGEDFVTKVPLAGWGYSRYGIDLLLPSRSYTHIHFGDNEEYSYSDISHDMEETFNGLGGSKEYAFYENGTQDVDELVNTAYSLASNANEYYDNKYFTLSNTLFISLYDYFMGVARVLDYKNKGSMADLGVDSVSKFYPITKFFLKNHIASYKIFSAHSVAGYYSWMHSCGADALFGNTNEATRKVFKRLKVACPVDVYVYSEDGELVASVVNEVVIENTLAVSVTDEGIKYIDLPNDQKYELVVKAREDCVIDYSVEELTATADGSEAYHTVEFTDISMETNDVLAGVLPQTDNQQDEVYKLSVKGYTVSFIDRGTVFRTVTPVYNMDTVETPILPKRKGYVMLGWFTEENGEGIEFTEETPVTEDITLYAYWVAGTSYEEYTVVTIPDQLYTGSNICPKPIVMDGRYRLAEKTDYTLTYQNNKKVGAATVTIKGKGNYTKKITLTFDIIQKDISDEDIDVTLSDTAYNNKARKQVPTIKYGKISLKNNTDFTVSYKSADDNQCKEPGTVTATVTGQGNYCGTVVKTYRITDLNMSSVYVETVPKQAYTGDALTPQVNVYDKKGGSLLKAGEGNVGDYTISYSNNVNVGTGKIILTGINAYGGTKTISFKIVKGSIAEAEVFLTDGESVSYGGNYIYTGKAVKPDVLVRFGDIELTKGKDYTLSYSNNKKTTLSAANEAPKITVKGKGNFSGAQAVMFTIEPMDISSDAITVKAQNKGYNGKPQKSAPTVMYGSLKLKKGTDYTVTYTSVDDNMCVEQGTVRLTITGKGNFTGENTSASYRIADMDITNTTVKMGAGYVYTGSAIRPEIVVTDSGYSLVEGEDYTLSYANNVNAAAAESSKAPTVTIKGKGMYHGIVKKTFTIQPLKLVNLGDELDIAAVDAKYTGSAVSPKTTVTLNGKKLKPNKDYSISYVNNVNIAEKNANAAPAAEIIGQGNYTGTVKTYFRIYEKDISETVVSKIKNQLYTGGELTPKVEIKSQKNTDVYLTEGENEDYTVEYSNNVKIGRAKIVVTGRGAYGGTKTLKFTILPKWLRWFT